MVCATGKVILGKTAKGQTIDSDRRLLKGGTIGNPIAKVKDEVCFRQNQRGNPSRPWTVGKPDGGPRPAVNQRSRWTMSGTLLKELRSGSGRLTACVVLGVIALAAPVRAQTSPAVAFDKPSTAVASPIPTVAPPGGVVPAGCASCSAGLLGAPAIDVAEVHAGGGGGGCGDGCGGQCVPGRKPCDCCCDDSKPFAKLFCGFYECVCCNDPCYEPHWNALADAAFWQDAPRPITQLKLVFQDLYGITDPDKGEIFEARFNTKGGTGKNLLAPHSEASIRDFYMVNEAAVGRFSLSVTTPYQQTSIDGNVGVPANGGTASGASGLGDIILGTKSLLLDCELMQVAFEFNTFLPSGNFTKGLGTGHVSLEPALLMALKLTPTTYLQTELAYRFPIGGDQAAEGPLFHYHLSVNQLLWNCGHDIQLIGTAELNGWEIEGGGFTVVVPGDSGFLGSAKDVADSVSIGPGIRLVFCDKIDFGVAAYYSLTDDTFGREGVRAEFRWRF
jgi:hypothetical protein